MTLQSRRPGITKREALVVGAVLVALGLVVVVVSALSWTRVRVLFWGYRLNSSREFTSAANSAVFLAELGPSALPALTDALKDGDLHIRVAAAGALQIANGNTDRVLAALRATARHDPEREVRVAAGWSLYRRGLVAESMPYVAEALELEPYAHMHTLKMALATKFRIREAVGSVIGDCETVEVYRMDCGFRHLAEIAGGDIDDLPRLKQCRFRYLIHPKEAPIGPHDKTAILAEFKAWWEGKKQGYHKLEDVVAGKVAPYKALVRPEYR